MMNPFPTIGIAFYNNWHQDKEFIFIDFEIKIDNGLFSWNMGICGIGLAFQWNIPWIETDADEG